MIPRVCEHERDVLDLVAIAQWPSRADDGLRAHVAGCATCAEVAAIAAAVREWSDAEPRARVPEASVVWRRAQVRAREAAARTAARPVWAAQAVALVALIGALVWIGPGVDWFVSVWNGVMAAMPDVALELPSFTFWPAEWEPASLLAGRGRTALLALGGVILLASAIVGALGVAENSERAR